MQKKINYFNTYEHNTDLELDKDSIFYGDLLVRGNLKIEGNLTVYGDIDLVELICSGDVNCYQNVVCSSIFIEGDFNCSGSLSAESVFVLNNAYIKELKLENLEVEGTLVYREPIDINIVIKSKNKILLDSNSMEKEKDFFVKNSFFDNNNQKEKNKERGKKDIQKKKIIKVPVMKKATEKCVFFNCHEKVYLKGLCKEHYKYEKADSK